MDKLDGLSMDIEAAERDKLRAVFPQCFSEGRLDIDKLLNLCGEYITDDFEKYEFRWKGKSECMQLAGKRSAGTLRPCPEESQNGNGETPKSCEDWDSGNLYIEGDNLEVLKLLQTSYYRKVKMIYIDPPYNTGNDFVYADNFADPLARYREVTQQTTKSNPETMGRFHTNWLNMMYPRLRLAANLLRDDGVMLISIDDAEVENLKKLCNEIFGEENFVACLVYDKNRKNDAKYFSVGHEYMLIYFKSKMTQVDNETKLRIAKEGVEDVREEFERLRKIHNDDWTLVNKGLKALYASWDDNDERMALARFTKVDESGPYRDDGNINWPGNGGSYYDVFHPVTGKLCKKPISGWRYSPERLQEEIEKGHVVFGADETTVPRVRSNLFESDSEVMKSVMFSYAQTATNELQQLFDDIKVFDNPKNYRDLCKLIEYVTSPNDNDVIVDFFSGSATTAHAVMAQNAKDGGNRRFILVQLPENLAKNYESATGKTKAQLKISIEFLKAHGLPLYLTEIGKERIRRAGTKMKNALREHGWSSRNQQVTMQDVMVRREDDPSGDPNVIVGGKLYQKAFGISEAEWVPSNEEEINQDMAAQLDTGFRVFKLDSSNLKLWDDSPLVCEDAVAALEQRLYDYLDVLVPGRTAVEVVYEVMLKLGQDLCEPIVPIDLPGGRTVYGVGADVKFIVCLAPDITPEDAAAMAEHAPGRIIFAEQCFANSEAKSNVRLTLKDKGISIKTL